MYSFILILTLIIVSGVIAYIGDLTGFRIGKKKITIFGLRPHRTAVFITIITGILISVLTLSILAILSNDVRTALFGLDELKERQYYLSREIQVRNDMLESMRLDLKERTEDLDQLEKDYQALDARIEERTVQLEALLQVRERLSAEIERLEEEIGKLQTTVRGLYSGISWLREGNVIFGQGEQIAMTKIKGGLSEDVINQEMVDFLNSATDRVLSMGAKRDERTNQVLIISKNEYDELVRKIQESQSEMVVRLLASMNVIEGEPVIANFSLIENKLVFSKDEEVIIEEIPATDDPEEAENYLFSILRKVNIKAVQEGIIPDPKTSFVGTISAVNLFEMVQEIVECETGMQIKVISLFDTWSTGPFKVKMEAEKIVH
jgi:uncharacterized protein (DUF3084 family)